MPLGVGQRFKLLIWRIHVLLAIFLAFFSRGIRDLLREKARAVKLHVEVEVPGT